MKTICLINQNKANKRNVIIQNKTLVAVIITLFICLISSANSYAASVQSELNKIITHKLAIEKAGVGVAIAVINNDDITFQYFGVSNLQSKEKVKQDTLFEIGSITKTFTATALASMVNDGKITLTDPVQKYLPKNVVLPIKNNKPITFLSLANHTSGLPRLPANMQITDSQDPYANYSVDLMYEFLNIVKLTREVGEKQEYSNLGFGLLGHVLSVIDGKSYQAMIESRVLNPLNMTNTFTRVPDDKMSLLSDGHNSELKKTKHWQLASLSGAGAIKSDIQDMALYLNENINKKQLSNVLELAQTSSLKTENPANSIGLAWMLRKHENQMLYMHDGATGGFRSFIGFDARNKKGIVILTNSEFDLNDVGYHYLTNSLNKIALTTPKNIKLSAEQLSSLNGEFELMPGFTLTISNEDQQLYVQATGQQKFPLTAISSTEFVNNAVKVKIAFATDEMNKATSLTMYQAGQTMVGKKL